MKARALATAGALGLTTFTAGAAPASATALPTPQGTWHAARAASISTCTMYAVLPATCVRLSRTETYDVFSATSYGTAVTAAAGAICTAVPVPGKFICVAGVARKASSIAGAIHRASVQSKCLRIMVLITPFPDLAVGAVKCR